MSRSFGWGIPCSLRRALIAIPTLTVALLPACGSAALTNASVPQATQRVVRSSGSRVLDIPGRWKVILNSNFSGRKLNTSLWQAGWFGTGHTTSINSNETACYNSRNVTFPGDGTVHLAVTPTSSACDGVTKPYTGAIISTNPDDGRASGGFQYTYGVLEAKVYIPSIGATIANWPSLVTLGQRWPYDGEDDIMESLNGIVCFHFHSPQTPVHSGAGLCDSSVTPGWHTFATDWAPGSITYYYDGTEVVRVTTGVTSSPMYIMAVNTTSVRFPAVVRPAAMRIAYIRVLQPVGSQAARRGYKHSF